LIDRFTQSADVFMRSCDSLLEERKLDAHGVATQS
jgi:hypothetical protein